MEKTAVEWFVREIAMKNNDINFDFWEAVEKAKKMEKQQIIKATSTAYEDMFGTDGIEYGEKYYNNIFKNK